MLSMFASAIARASLPIARTRIILRPSSVFSKKYSASLITCSLGLFCKRIWVILELRTCRFTTRSYACAQLGSSPRMTTKSPVVSNTLFNLLRVLERWSSTIRADSAINFFLINSACSGPAPRASWYVIPSIVLRPKPNLSFTSVLPASMLSISAI